MEVMQSKNNSILRNVSKIEGIKPAGLVISVFDKIAIYTYSF